MAKLQIYLEEAGQRTFAGAIEWPGLDRGSRDAGEAQAALIGALPRYRAALGAAARGLPDPTDPSDLEVAERHAGGGDTDFGIPSRGAKADEAPVTTAQLRRLTRILEAAWAAFDASADAARDVELRKGPRGGGRSVDKIREHVLGGERAYLHRIGGTLGPGLEDLTSVRRAALDALGARARNEPFEMGRRTAPLWTPRYFVRRSAWHALDHAWEIEDRSGPDPA